MKIVFKEYVNEDKQTLLELSKKLGKYSKDIDPLKRVLNMRGFAELELEDIFSNVKKYQGKIWFAEDEGKKVGYIIGVIWKQSHKNKLEIGPYKLGEVIDLYLDESYRGKGVGKRLLGKMEEYFKVNKCDSMWVQVFEPNKNAHEVYKKFGFVNREIGMLKNI